jgi:predicted DNA-binding transcriptional regulator YafY
VFGSGIEAWLRSQGSLVKVLEPKDLVERMRAEAEKCRAMYEK